MKRNSMIFAAVLTGVLALYSCGREAVVSAIRLSLTEVVLSEGEDTLLTAVVEPAEYSGRIAWESMDSSVAEVAADGRVTAVSGGRTFVLAAAGGLTKGCAVTVKTDIKSIDITLDRLLLAEDGGTALKYVTVPETVYHTRLIWESSDPAVVFANEGLVRAEGLGTAMVTVYSEDNPDVRDVIEVEVAKLVSEIRLSHNTAVMFENQTLQLEASVTPEDSDYPLISWSSSDKEVVTVDQTGLITSVGIGTAKVIAEAAGGAKAECDVTVREPLPNPEIDESVEDLKTGDGFDSWTDKQE